MRGLNLGEIVIIEKPARENSNAVGGRCGTPYLFRARGRFAGMPLAPVAALFVLLALVLFSRDAHAAGAGEYDWWWVFYERQSGAADTHLVVRPFYLANESPDGNRFYASLMPFVYWAYETPRNDEWLSLLGLVHSVDYRHSTGVRDYDFGVFPFFFYGDSPDERDRYFLLWPLGGTIRGKLGQDRITAWVFPGFALFFLYPPAFPPTLLFGAVLIASFVPLYVDYESRDYRAWGVLWPLIQRGQSHNRDDMRVLPFYSHNFKQGSYDNYSWFLLFNYQQVYMKDDVQRTFFILPLYGRRWNSSGKAGASTLLWPLFSWGYSRKAGSLELNFPWPLVQVQESVVPRVSKRIFFPFYGRYRYEERETFFATPLYFSMRSETRNFQSEYHISMLIVWYFTREYRDRPSSEYGSRWRYFKIWPLFQYEYDDRGNLTFNTLSLLPWRDPEGYERLYQPFWTLFEYRRFQDGEKRLGLLLRLYSQRWNDTFLHVKVPFLFTLGRENGQLTEWSILLSMFEYRMGNGGSYIRLFWVPVDLSGGGRSAVRAGDGPRAAEDYSDQAIRHDDYASYNASSAFSLERRMVLHSARVF